MKELVCIVCPKGCRLRVDEENGYAVTGNSCPRGAVYGHDELVNPTRVLTSTVKIEGGLYPRLPVKTDKPIPKGKIWDVMKLLDGITLHVPVQVGERIAAVPGTDAFVVASRDMD